jgi:signal transduction histidine kinase/heme exporter protein D
MSYLREFFQSMTGRLFVWLALGMATAALIATVITNLYSSREFERQLAERTADLLQGYSEFLDAAPPDLRTRMLRDGGTGVRLLAEATTGAPDPGFTQVLAARGGVVAGATAETTRLDVCFPEIRNFPMADMMERLQQMRGFFVASGASFVPPECRVISLRLRDGTALKFSLTTPWVQRLRSRLLDPAFLGLFGFGIVLLAFGAARFASAPLRRMAEASADLGRDLDRAPLALTGPSEVRKAAAAFNSMQARLQSLFAERTQMLAAITHDLQTPLTRLRLRLERVEDEELRERLVADLLAMRALIDEGLELARTAETAEPRVLLDLDSLLESLVEDAVDAGGTAEFMAGCGAVLQLRPLATRRMFANLIDNALKHGGSAAVSAAGANGEVTVLIRDRGPGLPDALLERAFDPFVRAEDSRSRETGGTGLGLTIARTLALQSGATLTLRNHPEGGLEARVVWPSVG